MKSFKEYVTMNEKASVKKGYDLKVGDVILYGREDTPHKVTGKPKQDGPGYWVEVLNLSNKKKDRIYVDSGDTVTMNEKYLEDLEDEVELNEEDFSKIKPLIDKDIKQIRDNLFEDSKTISKVQRTFNAYPGESEELGTLKESSMNESLPKGFIAYNTMIVLGQALRKGAGELDKHVMKSIIRRFELDKSASVDKLQNINILGYNFGLRDIQVMIDNATFKLSDGSTETIKNVTYQIPMI